MTEDEATLLAHLAPWIDETVATRALAYILNRSPASRQELDSLLRDGGINVAPIDEIETEVDGPGTGRVDIVCNRRGNAKPPVLIELKFLAGLTRNQPSRYLDWLQPKEDEEEDEESVLLFVVPEARVGTLGPELKKRAERGARKLVEVEAERSTCMRIDGTRCHLMVVSWGTLLDGMASRSRAAGESPGIEADILQLSGLARQKSNEVVPPFTVQYLKLGPDVKCPRKLDLRQIVDDAVRKAEANGWVNTRRLSTTRPTMASPHGRYFRFTGTPRPLNRELWLGVSNERWKDSETPLYLWFFNPRDLELLRDIGELSGKLEEGYIPIDLKPDVEMEQVVDDVARQIKDVLDLIMNASAAG